MNPDAQTTSAQNALIDLERVTLNAFAQARAIVTAQAEEIRRLRVEEAKRNDDALTEQQVADIMQVGLQTIADLRKRKVIEPSFYLISLPRYWRSKLPEIFANQKSARWKRRLKLVREKKAS